VPVGFYLCVQAIVPDISREAALDWLCYSLPAPKLPRALAVGGATLTSSAAPVKVVIASAPRDADPSAAERWACTGLPLATTAVFCLQVRLLPFAS